MGHRHAISDADWARIEHLLPGRPGDVGWTSRDNRLFVDAVLYVAKTGIPWRDLPERFGGGRTCTHGSADGLPLACGRECFSTSPQMPTTNMR